MRWMTRLAGPFLIAATFTVPAASAQTPEFTVNRDRLRAAIALRRVGYGVCTVRLPNRALADLGTSAQYVAFAGLRAARLSERKIAIIGHSQGGLLSVWVAKFWPNLARQTSDVVSLAGPVRGTQLANALCSVAPPSRRSARDRTRSSSRNPGPAPCNVGPRRCSRRFVRAE